MKVSPCESNLVGAVFVCNIEKYYLTQMSRIPRIFSKTKTEKTPSHRIVSLSGPYTATVTLYAHKQACSHTC